MMKKSEKVEIFLEFLSQYILTQFWTKIAHMAKYKATFHKERGLEMLQLLIKELEGEE